MEIIGPLDSVYYTALSQCPTGGQPPQYNITLTGSGALLTNGETLNVHVGVGELNQSPEACIGCGVTFSGSLVITGYTFPPPPVPEFPLGLVALLGVALPVMFVLRARSSGKLRDQ